MNDPNRLIQWNGTYHLFNQHNPNGPYHGTIHWGHAVSADLLHWDHLPIALAPTPDLPDAARCYSGCAVDHGEPPYRETQCVATSSDELRTWQRSAHNAVIVNPPAGMELLGFRDPSVWGEVGAWWRVLGSGVEGSGGMVALYTSPDLVHWEYEGPLVARPSGMSDPLWTGQIWECPQFSPLGDRHVLIVSIWDAGLSQHTVYLIGRYADQAFTPHTVHKFDLGGDYYAPATLLDDQGRRLVWGWSWEARRAAAQQAAGWAGVMALPRVLTLRSDDSLAVAPAAEVEQLRGAHTRRDATILTPTSSEVLPDVAGDCLEISVEFDCASPDPREFGLLVRCALGHEEYARIGYDRSAGQLFVDRERASLDHECRRAGHGDRCPMEAGNSIRLRVFLDRSIVEVYGNNRVALTERICPSRPDSIGLDLFAHGGSVMVIAVDVWTLDPKQYGRLRESRTEVK